MTCPVTNDAFLSIALTKRITKGEDKYVIAFCPKCATDEHWKLHNRNAYIQMHMKTPINTPILGVDIVLGHEKRKTQADYMRKPKEPPPLQKYVVYRGLLQQTS
jgi:hypothetical protein